MQTSLAAKHLVFTAPLYNGLFPQQGVKRFGGAVYVLNMTFGWRVAGGVSP